MANKLKTLNDIEKETEQLSMKDIDQDSLITGIFDDLREQAMSRIKAFEENMLKNKGCQPGTLGWLRNEELKSNIALFNDFFNIKEDNNG